MANPAELLHSQFVKWDTKLSQGIARKLSTDEGWIAQQNAVTNLNHLASVISEMKNSGKPVDIEEAYLPNWTKAVFAYPNGWNGGTEFIQETTLQFLLQTAHRLSDFIPAVTAEAPNEILESASELEKALSGRDDIPPALRMLVAESIGFLRNAVLEYELTGEFILNKAVRKFSDILELLEQTFPAEQKFSRMKYQIHRWYRSTPAQLALAGVISAQTALLAPVMNAAITDFAVDTINVATEVFELPSVEELAEEDTPMVTEDEPLALDTPEEPDQ